MRKLAVTTFMALLLAATGARAEIITGSQVKLFDGPGTLNAGAFIVVSPDSDSFLTFCLERDEYVSYNTTYYVKLGTSADDGGIGGPSPDPLDSRTAFLYSQFLDGQGYFTSVNQYVMDGLQLAIWRIEQEVDRYYSGLGTSYTRSLANQYYRWASGIDHGGSLYGVQVMQLWGTPNFDPRYGKQDQLVRVSRVPDGGATLMLLGGALVALGALRRKAD